MHRDDIAVMLGHLVDTNLGHIFPTADCRFAQRVPDCRLSRQICNLQSTICNYLRTAPNVTPRSRWLRTMKVKMITGSRKTTEVAAMRPHSVCPYPMIA